MDLLIRLKEWDRRRGRPVSDPDPADRLAGNAAADLIQRDKDRPCSIWVLPWRVDRMRHISCLNRVDIDILIHNCLMV
jgi:hypothetical protein